jgi:hypothetical protein
MLSLNDSTSEWVTLLVMFDKSKTKGNIEHQTKWNLKKTKKCDSKIIFEIFSRCDIPFLCTIKSLNTCHIYILVVPVTFEHPWLRHSGHPEHAVVPTDVVQVSEPVVCTFRLSVRVFTPLPDMRKPKIPVLTFWTLVLESFGNFQKHVLLYNRRFFRYI